MESELLEVEGVALGPGEDLIAHSGVEGNAGLEAFEQRLARLLAERPDRDRGVVRAHPEARSSVSQLGPRGREHEERAGRAQHDLFGHVEQLRGRPVHVL